MQYIGARYVPKWYVNSVDETSNWEVNVEYEPLTWVTTPNNHLYLSKKTVPDNIGTPAQNTQYWLDMGVFTGGSTQELQDQIDDIVNNVIPPMQTDISDLETAVTAIENNISIRKNRRIIIMGDSYNISSDGTAGTRVTSVGDRIKTLYPDRASEIIANWAVGGAGFNVKADTHTFIEYLDEHYTDITDRDSVTDLLLFGGYNEILTTMNNTISGGETFCNKVKQYFPNCLVHLAFVAWGTNTDSVREKLNKECLPAYQNIVLNCDNAVLVKNAEYILHTYSLDGTDGVHPNDSGYDVLALYLGSYILNNNPIELYGYEVGQTFTKKSTITGTGTLRIYCDRSNEITHIRSKEGLVFTAGLTFQSDRLVLGTINREGLLWGYVRPDDDPSIRIPVNAAITYNGSTYYERSYLEIYNGNVDLWAPGYNNLAVTKVDIIAFQAEVLTILC